MEQGRLCAIVLGVVFGMAIALEVARRAVAQLGAAIGAVIVTVRPGEIRIGEGVVWDCHATSTVVLGSDGSGRRWLDVKGKRALRIGIPAGIDAGEVWAALMSPLDTQNRATDSRGD